LLDLGLEFGKIFSGFIVLFHFRGLISIYGLGVPDVQVSSIIDCGVIKLAKLNECKIVWKIFDFFGREIFELQDGVGTCLVVAVAPDVSIVLFRFLCAKVSVVCEESGSEKCRGQIREVFLEGVEHWSSVIKLRCIFREEGQSGKF
jgi:hypothetical protein